VKEPRVHLRARMRIALSKKRRELGMQHVQVAFANARLLADDEPEALRLRSLCRTSTPEEWRRTLFQAADILDHLGWCRGTLTRGARHCAVGAILAAYSEGGVKPPRYANSVLLLREPALEWLVGKVTSHLSHLTDSSAAGVMAWNDKMAKDGKEVAELLRAVAGT
jgi:hypothetical protein